MKLLTFLGGILVGVLAIVMTNQVGEAEMITVHKDHYNELTVKYNLLEKEIRELTERISEKEKETMYLNNLILQKEILLKQMEDQIIKLGGKPDSTLNETNQLPEKVKAEEIKAKFDKAFAKNDGEKVMQYLRELIALGPEAYNIAVNLWRKINQDHWGDNKLNLTRQQLQMTIAEVNFVKWALANNTIDHGIRRNAIFILPYLDPKSAPTVLSSALAVEKDGDLKRQFIRSLGDFKNKDSEKVLLDILYKENNLSMAREIIDSLSGYHSDEVTKALTTFTSSTDQNIADSARIALIAQNSPVNGYVVTRLNRSSQAEKGGIKKGDIILGYNNQPVKNGWVLGDLIGKTSAKDTVTVTIYRNGSLLTLTLKGGRLGLDGRTVRTRT